jgi:hypothetical protein
MGQLLRECNLHQLSFEPRKRRNPSSFTWDFVMIRGLICFFQVSVLVLVSQSARAIRPDECEQQRALYPKNWNDISKEMPLFQRQSHYSGALRISIGAPDNEGRSLMSLIPLEPGSDHTPSTNPERPIHRIWLDKDQTRRLKEGKYFGTVVRTEQSCWVRGDLSGDPVFFMDNADPKPDSPDAGAFYNKAPRISSFKGDAYSCEAIK